ncbi:MAG: hypothetical protein DWQ37_09800 [Planctomycetota bacterium]|nr:MAG: hypothetical protein DWQ37_09800 [Planctomycetota bacterium]
MKKLSMWRVMWAGAILGALVVGMASRANAQTAEEIAANSIKAQGGREALTGLKALERQGDVAVDGAFGQMEGTVKEVIVPGKKAYRALDLAVFVQTDGWNGETAWRDGMMGLQELEGDEAAQIKQSVELNPFLNMGEAKLEKLDDETVDDVEYYVVEMTGEGRPPIKLYVDKESNQIKRTTLKQNNPQFGEVEIAVEIGGYEQFGPVKLPTTNKATIGEILEIDTTYTETKVNGDVDQAIFEMPKDEPAEESAN